MVEGELEDRSERQLFERELGAQKSKRALLAAEVELVLVHHRTSRSALGASSTMRIGRPSERSAAVSRAVSDDVVCASREAAGSKITRTSIPSAAYPSAERN